MKRKTAVKSSQTFRQVCRFGLALLIICSVSSSVYALDPLGPPVCELLKGEYKGGIDVSLSRQDFEMSPSQFSETINDVTTVGTAGLTLKDFETYRAYVNLAYSPIYNWEAFVRLGGAIGKLGDEFWSQSEEFDSRRELALGGGIRVTFYEELALKIGGLVQANLSQFDGKLDASHWLTPDILEIEMLEIQAALGATYLFSDRFAVYGGPFAHLIYGDIDYVNTQEDGGTLTIKKFNWDIDDDINYGGYFGAQFKLRRDCSFNIEYQQTSDAQAIGASLMLRR